MTTYFAMNGSAASLAPHAQTWTKLQTGTDHNGAPLYSQFKEVDLHFDSSASVPQHSQWIDNLDDGGSHTLDIIGENELGFVTLSPVYISIIQRPTLDGNVSGPFMLKILRAT